MGKKRALLYLVWFLAPGKPTIQAEHGINMGKKSMDMRIRRIIWFLGNMGTDELLGSL